jgi:hypothetical protein
MRPPSQRRKFLHGQDGRPVMMLAHLNGVRHACIVLSLNRKFCGFGEKRDSAEILEYRLAKQFEPRVKDGARIAENFGLRREKFWWNVSIV